MPIVALPDSPENLKRFRTIRLLIPIAIAIGFLVVYPQIFPELFGQDSSRTKIKSVEALAGGDEVSAKELRKEFRGTSDSSELSRRIADYVTLKAEQGYLEFSMDSLRWKSDSLLLSFHPGHQYKYGNIAFDNLNDIEMRKAGFDKLSRRSLPADLDDLEMRIGKSLSEYLNNGYPFASFALKESAGDPANEKTIFLSFRYTLDAGKMVRMDSVIFHGNARESSGFISSMIDLKKGDLYNQGAIDRIPKTLNNSLYFRKTETPVVTFNENLAKLEVTLEQKKAGKFDLLLGLLPPQNPADRKFNVTGLLDFRLVSPLFSAGEILKFRYDKLVGTSQKLSAGYSHPYIAGTSMKGEFDFDLLKQDTSFLNRRLGVAGHYEFSPGFSVRAWYKLRASSLISTTAFENDSINLPPVLDANDQTFGLGFLFENLDYRTNPTRGFSAAADFGIGTKRIRKNPKLHPDLYDGLQLSLPKNEFTLEFHFYRQLISRQVIHLANRSYRLDQSQYFRNDLLQAGGAQSIRGFNENQFYASLMTFFTFEYRYLLEQNSFLFAFLDWAYLENGSENPFVQRPMGTGVGMTYDTRAGMVTVTYAVGKSETISFQPSRGRIHVGLINEF